MPGIGRPGSVKAADLRVPLDQVRRVEQCAADAWPPTEVHDRVGWRIRYSKGIANRRANSVLPLTGPAPKRLSQSISEVETFYATRGLPSRFMVSPACVPGSLDEELACRGYAIDAPTHVQWAKSAEVATQAQTGFPVEFIDAPTAAWMACYMEGETNPRALALKMRLIARIEPAHVLAQISGADGIRAVGLCVAERGWGGIFCMHTLKAHQRRGLARQILAALATWSADQAVADMYLQVEHDNSVAKCFYQQSGFETQYGYHYRTKEIRRERH